MTSTPPTEPALDLEAIAVRSGVVHDLKTWPEPFAAVRAGLKPWELRLDDRNYQVGDVLRLREWSPAPGAYTGEVEERVVAWKLDGGQFGLPVGYAILSLAALSTPSPERAEGAPAAEGARHEGWRCFQCDELFMDERAAVGHFGRWSHHSPACMAGETFQGLKTAYNHLEADFYAMKSRAEAAEAALSPPAAEGKEDVRSVRQWLLGLHGLEMDEIAADGGITVGMVVQQQAVEMAGRLGRYLSHPAPAAEPVAWQKEYRPGRFHISTSEQPDYQPLYASPPPEPVAISRDKLVELIQHITRRGRNGAYISDIGLFADAILAKMKPNLKEEGGLSQSQPGVSAVQLPASPETPRSGGGEG